MDEILKALQKLQSMGIDIPDLIARLEDAANADEELKIGYKATGLVQSSGSLPPVPLDTPLERMAAHMVIDLIDRSDLNPGNQKAEKKVHSHVNFWFIHGSEDVVVEMYVRPKEE